MAYLFAEKKLKFWMAVVYATKIANVTKMGHILNLEIYKEVIYKNVD